MEYIEETGKVPVCGRYDVIVAGGGVAGVAAALAASRQGKRVLLLEKSVALGGLATIGLINFFVPMCNGRGKQVIWGMAEEFLQVARQRSYDDLPPEWRDGEPKQPTAVRKCMRYSHTVFALEMVRLLREAGADILYDTVASRPVMQGGHCEGLIVEHKGGREFYAAGTVVDTTGEADILHRAGVPCVQGANYMTYLPKTITLDSCRRAVESGNIAKAYTGGMNGGAATLYGDRQPEGQRLFRGTHARDISEYLIDNQLLALEGIDPARRMEQDIAILPMMCQLRTTRHIDGEYTLKMGDCFRHFDDSVTAVNDFDERDLLFEVPYRTLYHRGFDNLLTAGRCASGEGYAWDILRVIPPAIVTGQAAGLAACQALDSGRGVDEIDVEALQKTLADQNVLLHFDDSWIPEQYAGDAFCDLGHI